MYINPFLAGVVRTVFAEILIIIAIAFYQYFKIFKRSKLWIFIIVLMSMLFHFAMETNMTKLIDVQ